jgi:uncharacterized membrane protein
LLLSLSQMGPREARRVAVHVRSPGGTTGPGPRARRARGAAPGMLLPMRPFLSDARRALSRPWSLCLAAALAVLACAVAAEAQWTGGSVGGGDFSGGGGHRDSHRGGGGSSDGLGIVIDLVILLFRINPLLGIAALVVILVFLIWRSGAQSHSLGHRDDHSVGSTVPSPTSRRWFHVDITEVRVALDARARGFLQRELMQEGRRADMRTPAGRLALLRTVVRALREAEPAWIYAGAKNFHPMSSILAETTFKRLAGEARAKFTHELLRADARGIQEGEGHGVVRSREREGEGVVLVTLIAAASREIVDFETSSRAEVLKVLGDLDALFPQTLVALEVSWLPADEHELMSTATLEALHPDMKKLPGVVGGRVFCEYCKGPYAAELPRCPHCGAPSVAAARASTVERP